MHSATHGSNSEESELFVELPTRRATIHLGRRLASLLGPGDLMILSGSLGAGKTFLVRALCRALNWPSSEPVTSPTFTLIHEYETSPPIAHADLYRLGNARDVIELGLAASRTEGRLVLVEWGAPYLDALGGDALLLDLSLDPRRAQLRATGPRSATILSQFSAQTLESGPPSTSPA